MDESRRCRRADKLGSGMARGELRSTLSRAGPLPLFGVVSAHGKPVGHQSGFFSLSNLQGTMLIRRVIS